MDASLQTRVCSVANGPTLTWSAAADVDGDGGDEGGEENDDDDDDKGGAGRPITSFYYSCYPNGPVGVWLSANAIETLPSLSKWWCTVQLRERRGRVCGYAASLVYSCPSSPCISLGLVPHYCCWSGARARLLTDTKEESLHHLPCGSLDSRPSDDSTLHLSLSSFPTLSRQIDVVHNLNPPTYLSENTPRNNNLTELGSSKFVFKYLEEKGQQQKNGG